jgi:hypothetical protein
VIQTKIALSASVAVLLTVNVTGVAAANTDVKHVISPTSPFAVTAVLVDVCWVTATSIVLVSFRLVVVYYIS